jgi:hypothetical protein
VPTIATKFFTRVRNVPQPDSACVDTVPVDIEFPAVAFAANDMIRLIEIPAGVTVQDYAFVFPDIDSGGSPAFAFSFGVMNAAGTDLATVYASGLTAGQSTTIVRATTSVAAQDAANNVLVRSLGIKVTTAAATYDGAGKTGTVLLSLRG